jgi:hypothetical protein
MRFVIILICAFPRKLIIIFTLRHLKYPFYSLIHNQKID